MCKRLGIRLKCFRRWCGQDRIMFRAGGRGHYASAGTIRQVKKRVTLPVRVLVRPRSGHFCYSEAEKAVLLADIAACREAGVDGIVSGAFCLPAHWIFLLWKSYSKLLDRFRLPFIGPLIGCRTPWLRPPSWSRWA